MKKFSILLALVLVLGLAVPAVAATDLDINGTVGVENGYTEDDTSSTEAYVELYLKTQTAENVTLYSEIDFTAPFDGANGNNDEEVDVYEAWVNIDEAFGPVDLKAGRMYETAPDGMLYEFDSDDFVRLAYEKDNFTAKFGHNVDTDDSEQKLIFAEGKVTDLEVLDEVTLNYVENNVEEYDGYTMKFAKTHDFVDAALTYGDADQGDLSGGVLDLNLSTDQLLPGATVALEYADVEEGFVGGVAQDSSLTSSDLTEVDSTMIKPGVNFDVTDKLAVSAAYAMYDADDIDAEDNYLDIVCSYDIAENTLLEVELEDHDYDGSDLSSISNSLEDETVITTTLETYF